MAVVVVVIVVPGVSQVVINFPFANSIGRVDLQTGALSFTPCTPGLFHAIKCVPAPSAPLRCVHHAHAWCGRAGKLCRVHAASASPLAVRACPPVTHAVPLTTDANPATLGGPAAESTGWLAGWLLACLLACQVCRPRDSDRAHVHTQQRGAGPHLDAERGEHHQQHDQGAWGNPSRAPPRPCNHRASRARTARP